MLKRTWARLVAFYRWVPWWVFPSVSLAGSVFYVAVGFATTLSWSTVLWAAFGGYAISALESGSYALASDRLREEWRAIALDAMGELRKLVK